MTPPELSSLDPLSHDRPAAHRLAVIDAAIAALLAAHRAGTLAELVNVHRPPHRRRLQRFLGPVKGAAGDRWPEEAADLMGTRTVLRWMIERTRPDQTPFAAIDRSQWLDSTSWRPTLALLCHFEFARVPDFPDRYRRRPQEPAAETLCGIWSVGPSTFYRYLEKGRRRILEIALELRRSGKARTALRLAAQHGDGTNPSTGVIDATPEWHVRQRAHCVLQRRASDALWHDLQAGEPKLFIEDLRRFRVELAGDVETEHLIAAWHRHDLPDADGVHLLMAHSDLLQTMGRDADALALLEESVQVADRAEDNELLGIAYGALGKFLESRDTDRALVSLQDSVNFLKRAHEAVGGESSIEYLKSLQRLAWFYVIRNDPRSRIVLDASAALAQDIVVPPRTSALLEQTWGEYWRRAGELRRALEHKHRALNIFQRLGDRREVLSTYNNLSLLYVEDRQYDLAERYARMVKDAATEGAVDPYLLVSGLGNLGIALFWQKRIEEAIREYRAGLDEATRSGLPILANRARFNLAEACFQRFAETGDPDFERQGDEEIARLMLAPAGEREDSAREAAPRLKAEILNSGHVLERFWPQESVVHFDEMSQIQRHRALLAIPASPRDAVRSHLALAQAYLDIARKERESAMAIIARQQLGSEFDAALDALQLETSQAQTQERSLQATWRHQASTLLAEDRREAVLRYLIAEGSINKSRYADLCQCGLATASKHLRQLTDLGLLLQSGKGPSTRYQLAER